MTDPPMYNVASAVLCCSLAIVRSLPLPGCVLECFLSVTMQILICKVNITIVNGNTASIASGVDFKS